MIQTSQCDAPYKSEIIAFRWTLLWAQPMEWYHQGQLRPLQLATQPPRQTQYKFFRNFPVLFIDLHHFSSMLKFVHWLDSDPGRIVLKQGSKCYMILSYWLQFGLVCSPSLSKMTNLGVWNVESNSNRFYAKSLTYKQSVQTHFKNGLPSSKQVLSFLLIVWTSGIENN